MKPITVEIEVPQGRKPVPKSSCAAYSCQQSNRGFVISSRAQLPCLASLLAVLTFLAVAPASAGAAGGTAMGWGYNASGQVGNGSVSPSGCSCVETPTQLVGVSEIAELTAGYEFGLALRTDGRVMAWGYNYGGELGDGTTDLNPVPTLVPGVSNVVAVAAGSQFALALRADGAVMAWGENS
jgi:hypothetical protein